MSPRLFVILPAPFALSTVALSTRRHATALLLAGMVAGSSSNAQAAPAPVGEPTLTIGIFVAGLTADLIVSESSDVKAAVAVKVEGADCSNVVYKDSDSGFSGAFAFKHASSPCGFAGAYAIAREGIFGSGYSSDHYTSVKSGGNRPVTTGDADVKDQWEYRYLEVAALALASLAHTPTDSHAAGAAASASVDGDTIETFDEDAEQGSAVAVVSLTSGNLVAVPGQAEPTERHYYAAINDAPVVDTLVLLGLTENGDCALDVDGDLLDANDFRLSTGSQGECTASLIGNDHGVEIPLGVIDKNGLFYTAFAGINPDLIDEIEGSEGSEADEGEPTLLH